MEKKLAILTSGGDAPGMNAAIRATAKIAESYGFEVYGIRRGYLGMLNDEIFPMTGRFVSGIIDKGGTVLLTARSEEFKQAKFREIAANNLKLSSQSLLKIGLIDGIIDEALGGAHRGPEDTAFNLKRVVLETINELEKIPVDELVEKRYDKFRQMGVFNR